MKFAGRDVFSSLRVRNFRLYFVGQILSTSGTYVQGVALAWLVLGMTGSGTALGVVTACLFVPILFLAPLGGAIADRFPRWKLILVTQVLYAVLAFSLGIVVATGSVRLWMVYVVAFAFGLISAVDNPIRHTFIPELVGEKRLRNAVTLNSSAVNTARIVGPTIAGLVIATFGLAPCFILNGFSYGAVIAMLTLMDKGELFTSEPEKRRTGYLDGFRYIISKPELRLVFLMVAFIGTLAYEFQVSFPLLAKETFHGDAKDYAMLLSAFGVGAVIGGFLFAGHKKTDQKTFILLAFLFGSALMSASVMPDQWSAAVFLSVAGVFSIGFTSVGNTMAQLGSAPNMRGRVMAFWSMAFMGSTAIGAPVIGWIGEYVGPRYGLGIGGLAAVLAAGYGFLATYGFRLRPTGRFAAVAVKADTDSHS